MLLWITLRTRIDFIKKVRQRIKIWLIRFNENEQKSCFWRKSRGLNESNDLMRTNSASLFSFVENCGMWSKLREMSLSHHSRITFWFWMNGIIDWFFTWFPKVIVTDFQYFSSLSAPFCYEQVWFRFHEILLLSNCNSELWLQQDRHGNRINTFFLPIQTEGMQNSPTVDCTRRWSHGRIGKSMCNREIMKTRRENDEADSVLNSAMYWIDIGAPTTHWIIIKSSPKLQYHNKTHP
jgi:hypothetical protein